MAYQHAKTEAHRTKKEPGWHRVPGVKKAAKKARRQADKVSIESDAETALRARIVAAIRQLSPYDYYGDSWACVLEIARLIENGLGKP